jgi:peptidyl-prolyl cis-trans isomerase D
MLMGKFRDNMKWIMLVTAITFVGLMVFGWGMDITGRSSASAAGGELGRVNGDPITNQEYITTYRNLYEQQRKQNPGQDINAALNRQIEKSAWDQLVLQKLISQELERRGITVSDAEVRQAARAAPPQEFMDNEIFKTNGQFDINKYYTFLASPSVDQQLLLQLEQYYRDVIPRSKLYYQVTSGTYVPETQMWTMWRDAKETVKIRYIAIDPNLVVPDASVTVTPKEIEKYYKENQDEFHRPASAKVRYVTMDRAATAQDSAAALARAKEIRQRVISGDFAEVAKKESADSVSGKNGGSLGTVRRGQMVPAFEQAVFAMKAGQVSEPVLTQFGYHIIKVDKITNDQPEARHILIPLAPSTANEEKLLDRADSLESLGQDMPLQRAAERMGLRAREGELNDSVPLLAGVGPAEDAASWIFKDAESGDVSEVFETPTVYYMVELISKAEAGVTDLKTVTPFIEAKLRTGKKLERAQESARAIADRIRKGATLDDAAQQSNLKVANAGPFTRLDFVPGIGRANAAIGTAFGLKPGQVSGVVEAEDILYIIQTVEKTEADRKEFETAKAANRLRYTQAVAEQRWNDFLAALKENAKIVDNRAALQKQQATQTAQ